MDLIRDYLPPTDGWYPTWNLIIAIVAATNSLQNLFNVNVTRRLYAQEPLQVTPLAARTSTVWHFLAAVVRFYYAYNIHDKAVYNLTLWTYALAFFHFTSELFVFRSAKLNAPVMSPIIVASIGFIWGYLQHDFYVR